MSNQFEDSTWQELYKAALFEDDGAKLPTRIEDAESAIIIRARAICSIIQKMRWNVGR